LNKVEGEVVDVSVNGRGVGAVGDRALSAGVLVQALLAVGLAVPRLCPAVLVDSRG
jgi:hypothetical protein